MTCSFHNTPSNGRELDQCPKKHSSHRASDRVRVKRCRFHPYQKIATISWSLSNAANSFPNTMSYISRGFEDRFACRIACHTSLLYFMLLSHMLWIAAGRHARPESLAKEPIRVREFLSQGLRALVYVLRLSRWHSRLTVTPSLRKGNGI